MISFCVVLFGGAPMLGGLRLAAKLRRAGMVALPVRGQNARYTRSPIGSTASECLTRCQTVAVGVDGEPGAVARALQIAVRELHADDELLTVRIGPLDATFAELHAPEFCLSTRVRCVRPIRGKQALTALTVAIRHASSDSDETAAMVHWLAGFASSLQAADAQRWLPIRIPLVLPLSKVPESFEWLSVRLEPANGTHDAASSSSSLDALVFKQNSSGGVSPTTGGVIKARKAENNLSRAQRAMSDAQAVVLPGLAPCLLADDGAADADAAEAWQDALAGLVGGAAPPSCWPVLHDAGFTRVLLQPGGVEPIAVPSLLVCEAVAVVPPATKRLGFDMVSKAARTLHGAASEPIPRPEDVWSWPERLRAHLAFGSLNAAGSSAELSPADDASHPLHGKSEAELREHEEIVRKRRRQRQSVPVRERVKAAQGLFVSALAVKAEDGSASTAEDVFQSKRSKPAASSRASHPLAAAAALAVTRSDSECSLDLDSSDDDDDDV